MDSTNEMNDYIDEETKTYNNEDQKNGEHDTKDDNNDNNENVPAAEDVPTETVEIDQKEHSELVLDESGKETKTEHLQNEREDNKETEEKSEHNQDNLTVNNQPEEEQNEKYSIIPVETKEEQGNEEFVKVSIETPVEKVEVQVEKNEPEADKNTNQEEERENKEDEIEADSKENEDYVEEKECLIKPSPEAKVESGEEEVPQVETIKEEDKPVESKPEIQEEQPKEEQKAEEESELVKNQKLLEKQMADLIAEGNRCKELGNQFNSQKNYVEAEAAYRQGIDIVFKFVPSVVVDVPSQEMMKQLADIGVITKLLHSNLSFALSNQKKYKESIKVAQQIVEGMDPNFFKSYVRILDCSLNLGDLDLANKTAEKIKQRFAPHVVDSAKEYFKILEFRNKEQEEKIASTLNKGLKKQAQASVDKSDTNVTSKDTSISEENKSAKVSKFYKHGWVRWILSPIIFIGSAAGIYFLVRNRSRFFK